MNSKYLIAIGCVAVLVILPPGIARLCGASTDLLLIFANAQLLLLSGYFLTVPVSLGFSFAAVVKKDWSKAGLYLAGGLTPFAAAWLAVATNPLGWEALMSI